MAWTGTGTQAESPTVGMTLDDMIDLMRIRMAIFLDGLDYKYNFTDQKAVLLLNKAQRKVITLVRRHFRHELDNDFTEQELDEDDGYFDLSTLDPLMFETYIGVEKVRLTGGRFCTKKSFEEVREITNACITPSTSKPIYYIRGNYLYVKPYESQTIDIYGYRRPVDMVIGSVDCELNEGLQDIIIEIAVEMWLNAIGKYEQSIVVRANYIDRIQHMHLTSPVSESALHESDLESSGDSMDDYPRQTIYIGTL